MGTGKTKVAIDVVAARLQAGQIKRALVFAPRSVIPTWAHEVKKHSDLKAVQLAGSTTQKRALLYRGLRDGWHIFITNYESVLSIDFAGMFQMLILDESTFIKNPWAKRTRNLVRVGDRTPFKMILSGYPVTQTLMDVWAQYRFLDNGQSFGYSFLSFRNRYFYSDRNGWVWTPRPSSIKEINDKMYRRAIRILKVDCIDLPPKVYERRYCTMEKEQARIYGEIRDKLVAEIENNKRLTVRQALVKTLRLCQISGGVVPTDCGAHKFFPSKLDVLREVIEENPGRKAVIWANFIIELDAIYNSLRGEYGQECAVLLHGGVKGERGEMVERFQNDPHTRFFIGQVKTGGYGITLTASDLVVYYSNSFSVEARVQSEDRTHRIGQTRSVTYIDLITEKTVDEYVLKMIGRKKKIADLTIGDIIDALH
jgi:SNF2 family DNA or RNA helicase